MMKSWKQEKIMSMVHTLLIILNSVCRITFAINISVMFQSKHMGDSFKSTFNRLCGKAGLGSLRVDKFSG